LCNPKYPGMWRSVKAGGQLSAAEAATTGEQNLIITIALPFKWTGLGLGFATGILPLGRTLAHASPALECPSNHCSIICDYVERAADPLHGARIDAKSLGNLANALTGATAGF